MRGISTDLGVLLTYLEGELDCGEGCTGHVDSPSLPGRI